MNENMNILFPNQLFENSPLMKNQNEFILVEEFLFFNQFKFTNRKFFSQTYDEKLSALFGVARQKSKIY